MSCSIAGANNTDRRRAAPVSTAAAAGTDWENNMQQVTLTISGEFEDDDMVAFAMLLRTVSQNNDRYYQIWISEPKSPRTAERISQLLPRTTIHYCQ